MDEETRTKVVQAASEWLADNSNGRLKREDMVFTAPENILNNVQRYHSHGLVGFILGMPF